MTERTVLEILLERYGETVTHGEATVRALIQPLRKTTLAAAGLPEQTGERMHFLYTGPAGEKLSAGEVLKTAKRDYTVQRADTYLLRGEEIYAWAVLTPLFSEAASAVVLESRGIKLGAALTCEEKAVQESAPMTVWGEALPSEITAGSVRYELTLGGVCAEEGADLYSAADFTATVRCGKTETVYSGCRWKTVSSAETVGGRPERSMTAYAAARTEQKVGESDG